MSISATATAGAALPADSAAVQLLLVRTAADTGGNRRAVASRASRIHDVGDAAWLGRSVQPSQPAAARTRCNPRVSAAATLVRGQGPQGRSGLGIGVWRARGAGDGTGWQRGGKLSDSNRPGK